MLTIELVLLTGRYVATAYNSREEAEWPPHPARLFSALVETWACDDPASASGEEERMALRWLERQPAPDIFASASEHIARRSVVPSYVPVNDTSVLRVPEGARERVEAASRALAAEADPKKQAKLQQALQKAQDKLRAETAKALAAPSKFSATDLEDSLQLLPEHRGKQPRTFPSVTPKDPVVAFRWPAAPEPRLTAALARLLARLTRLGHSSSMVAARLTDSLPPTLPTFAPDDDGALTLRWVGAGQIERLERAHHLHRGVEPRVLPCSFVRYREGITSAAPPLPRGVYGDEWIVFARADGPRLPSVSTVGVTSQFRKALFLGAGEPLPEVISGHQPDGSPSERPHLAILALPDCGRRYSHGGILGLALVLPRDIDEADRDRLLRAIGALEKHAASAVNEEEDGFATPKIALPLSDAGILMLEREAWGEPSLIGLRPATWTRASRFWASATPVALDRNPGDLHADDPGKRKGAFEEAEASIAAAIERLGLPTPVEIDAVRSCVLPGTEKPRRFPRFPISAQRPQRVLVHARLVFAVPVLGPILLGAGRHLGLGLFRPLDDEGRP